MVAALVVLVSGLGAPAAHASFPGTNGRILFTKYVNGKLFGQLYTVDPDHGARVRLTDGLGATEASWSADGRRIAYVKILGTAPSDRLGKDRALMVMNADGTGKHRLSDADAFDPAWSPDGSAIVFEKGVDLWLIDADGTHERRLADITGTEVLPAWSPDGRWIAFSEPGSTSPIRAVRPDGSGLRTVVPDRSASPPHVGAQDPNWAPDASQLVFMGGTDSGFEAFRVDADGKHLIVLTSFRLDVVSPAWSPDGTRIAFTGGNFANNRSEIYVMAADGSGIRQITSTTNGADWPDWQPVTP